MRSSKPPQPGCLFQVWKGTSWRFGASVLSEPLATVDVELKVLQVGVTERLDPRLLQDAGTVVPAADGMQLKCEDLIRDNGLYSGASGRAFCDCVMPWRRY